MTVAKVYEYFATTPAGLQEVAAEDLRERLAGLAQVRAEGGPRHGRVFFHYERSPRQLLDLRSVDNLYASLARIQGITTGTPGLRWLVERLRAVDLEPALALYDRLHPERAGSRCRLVCTVRGDHRFTSADLHRAAREALAGRCLLVAGPEPGARVLRLQVAGRQALFGLQLAPTRLRDRPYRRASVPGGLEATVAYDMARLAAVGRDQVCLDPMCGGGTLLIEAGLAFGPRRLIGGDCWRPALAATRQNASAAGVAVATIGWDAGGLPIRDASVDVALCNLPYGKRVDAPVDEGAVLRELARVLRPGGPAVLLAGPSSRMEALLGGAPFALRRRLRLRLRGVDPRLLVLERGRGA